MKYLFNDFIRRIALLYPIIKSKSRSPSTQHASIPGTRYNQLLRERRGRLAALLACATNARRSVRTPDPRSGRSGSFFLGRFQRIINRKKARLDTIVRNNPGSFYYLHKNRLLPCKFKYIFLILETVYLDWPGIRRSAIPHRRCSGAQTSDYSSIRIFFGNYRKTCVSVFLSHNPLLLHQLHI